MNIVESALKVDDRTARAQKMLPLLDGHRSPPGGLGLDPYVDARRLKYGIPDEAYKLPATYLRIFVMQVEEYDTEKFSPESLLYRPQTTQSREFQSSPRGLLISAGIEAMDTLYDHGIALGDIVWITQLGVLRLPYLRVGSEDLYFMVLQVGDIAAGEDTYNRLQSGELALKHDPASNTHYYQWRGQPARVPGKAFVPQEF